MKITRLEPFVVPPRWLFLKIETDEGIIGWGEPVVEAARTRSRPPCRNWPTTSSAATRC